MLLAVVCLPVAAVAQKIPAGAAIDAEVGKIMARTQAKGMAVAVIDRGRWAMSARTESETPREIR